jgi:hypothetical protein
VEEWLTNRVFVFTSTDDPDFSRNLQTKMVKDGTRRYLRFVAISDDPDPDDGYNVFVALDCNSDAQARFLAKRYFQSTLAFGRVMGALGLKHQ